MKDKIIILATGCAMLFTLAAPAQTPHTHQHRFKDAEKWAQIFDDPARDAWQKPDEVIHALALSGNALVADIGSGTGYFSARLARALPKGHVFGVDTEPDMVRFLADRAKRENLGNLSSVAGAPGSPNLPVAVDLILLVDVYHHVANREQYFRQLRSQIRSGGRLAIIDFLADAPMGPPPGARVPPGRVKEELARAGYALAEEHAFLPHQYFLVFRPAARQP